MKAATADKMKMAAVLLRGLGATVMTWLASCFGTHTEAARTSARTGVSSEGFTEERCTSKFTCVRFESLPLVGLSASAPRWLVGWPGASLSSLSHRTM